MKERLKMVLDNEKRHIAELKFEKGQLEWELKYAPSMTINGKARLEEINKKLKDTKDLYARLYWVYEG